MCTNKTQLLHRIEIWKYIPQAPLADHFVRETEWRTEITLLSQDDLFAHTWDTSFGTSPFDIEIEYCDQQEETVEYKPTSTPPNRKNLKLVGRFQQYNLLRMIKNPKQLKKLLQKKKILSPNQKV